ncbi:sporulation protein [Pontibacillus yanchengensis]|uniref:Sporulation protein n=1 Tax=Pontibacillus yanchengensis TaxID=462910 RepID=A0ACC7VKL6_9BACI|nr:CAP domain-containing protein [Pontibacillus yanchengensis]MYL54736.1 sporulation protein [Pontibacillus yanchengensis]
MFKKITITSALAASVIVGGVAQTEASAQSNQQAKNIQVYSEQSLQSFDREDIQNWFSQHLSDYQVKWGEQQSTQEKPEQNTEQQPTQEQPEQNTEQQAEPKEQQEAAPSQSSQQQEQAQTEQQNTEQQASTLSQYEQKVVELTNEERTAQGLEPLKIDKQLSDVAEKKSEDMAQNNYFSHNSPTYGSPFDMMNQFGVDYRTAGENIAKGQPTPQEVVDAWMNSEGHRKNIMNSDFTHIGVGFVEDGNLWTQQFIGK